jgi:hypothetical protein
MGRAVRGHLIVAVAVICASALGAPMARASLSVPTGGPPVTFTGSGASGTSTAMATFVAAAGGGDNGTTAGEQGGGFRHANWDQIALGGSDPGSTVISSGRVIAPARSRLQPWGLEIGPAQTGEAPLAGTEVAVANDGFHSVNPNADFIPFSGPNLWAPFNSTTAEFDVVAPAGQGTTATPAQTRGLGIVFLGSTGSAEIQYYNGDNQLAQGFVVAPAGTTSFAGLLFPDPVVTRVVVTLGGSEMFGFDGTGISPGGPNPVAGDDIVLAEPAPARSAVSATAGVPISPVLDTFSNTESSAVAAIDWGDGTRSPGTIVAAPGGAFNVTGTHTYVRTGTYTATVTVDDFAGDEQSSQTTIQVAGRPSATNVTCSPSPVAVTAATICTATVADAGPGGPITPTGTIAFSSPTSGAQFDDDSGCLLGPDGAPGVAICQVEFIPTQRPPLQARINAFYGGDGAHGASGATATVGVRPQRCTLEALNAKLSRRPAVLGVIVTCDARANVTITVKASAARHRPFRAFSLPFGTIKASIGAGRPTVLAVKPSASTVAVLRAALRRRQRVSLGLTLTATSHATRTTTTTRVAAVKLR